MTKSRGILAPRHRWTDDEIALLRAAYPDHRAEDVAARLWPGCKALHVYSKAKKLGLTKSAAFLTSDASGRLDGVRGSETRFKKGQKPIAGGTAAMIAAGVPTRFAKGQTPYNHLPVGTELVKTDGYLWVKVEEPKKWRQKHLLLWEQAHGVPGKGMKVCFKDGDRKNVVLDNLECIPQSELTKRNSIHRYPPELKEVIRLAAKVRRRINERAEETHQ